jgi:hypothetical protein
MKSNCSLPVFGPRAITAHDIRGIRFLVPADDDGAGKGGGDGKDGEKTLSQAEADQIVADRLARERKKFDGFDDFKAKAEKWEAHEAEQAKKNGKSSDDGKGGDKPAGPSDEDVQKRIDEALAAERVRSGSKLVSIALDKALDDGRQASASKILAFKPQDYVTPEGDVDQQMLDDWVKENTTESQEPKKRRDPSQGRRDSSANGGSVQSGRDAYAERHKKKSA